MTRALRIEFACTDVEQFTYTTRQDSQVHVGRSVAPKMMTNPTDTTLQFVEV